MAQEIKQRVTVDADQAVRGLEGVSRAEKKLASATKDAGNAADRTTDQMRRKSKAVSGVQRSVGSMVTRWLSFTAIAGSIVKAFTDIANAATESAKAVIQVGQGLRGLVANVGSEQASEVFQGVTGIAAENRFSLQGRSQLIQAVTSLTDLRDNLTTPQILAQARDLAKLQRATGVGGSQATGLFISLQESLGLSSEQAVDAGVTAINFGIDAAALRQIVERSGDAGGTDLLALLIAARGQGLDLNRAGRSIPSLIQSLTRTEDGGDLSKDLTSVGITEGSSLVDRISLLIEARKKGQVSEGQFNRAIGGAENLRFFGPFSRALDSGLLPGAKASLLDPQAAARVIEELGRNPFVRAQEQQNVRQLLVQTRRERSSLTATGAELLEFEAQTQDLPFPLNFAAFVGNLPNLVFPTDAEQQAQRNIAQIQGGGQPVVVNNVTNIGQQYNTEDPMDEVRVRERIQ